MSAIGWAILGAGALGAGASMFNASQTPDPQTGYDLVTQDTFGDYENLGDENIAMLLDRMRTLRQSGRPAWMTDEFMNSVRAQKEQPLNDRWLGTEGNRGGILGAMSAGAGMRGVGEAGTQQIMNQGYQGFNSEASQIDNYMAQFLGEQTAAEYNNLPQQVAGAPSGPPQTVVSYGGGATPVGGATSAGANLVGQAAYMYGQGKLNSTPQQPAWTTAGQYGGYGATTPQGVYNTGSMSILPSSASSMKTAGLLP